MSIINDALKKLQKQAKNSPQVIQLDPAGGGGNKNSEKKTFDIFAYKKTVIWVCIFVLIGVFIFVLHPPGRKPPVQIIKTKTSENADASVASPIIPVSEKGLPFSLENIFTPEVSRSGFQLSGIMLSEDGPVAIINNEIVKEGEVVNGATVSAIRNDSVKLSFQDQEFILSVK